MNMHQPVKYSRQWEDLIIIYRQNETLIRDSKEIYGSENGLNPHNEILQQSGFAFIPTTYDLVLSGQQNFTCLPVYIPKVCRQVYKWRRSGHPDFSG